MSTKLWYKCRCVCIYLCQSLNRVKYSLNIHIYVLSWVYRALLYHIVIYFAFIFVLCRWCIMFCSYIFKFVFVCDNTIRFPLYVYKWQWHIVCRLDRINKVEDKMLRKVRGCTRLCTVLTVYPRDPQNCLNIHYAWISPKKAVYTQYITLVLFQIVTVLVVAVGNKTR